MLVVSESNSFKISDSESEHVPAIIVNGDKHPEFNEKTDINDEVLFMDVKGFVT